MSREVEKEVIIEWSDLEKRGEIYFVCLVMSFMAWDEWKNRRIWRENDFQMIKGRQKGQDLFNDKNKCDVGVR